MYDIDNQETKNIPDMCMWLWLFACSFGCM